MLGGKAKKWPSPIVVPKSTYSLFLLWLLISDKDNFHKTIFVLDRKIDFGMVKLILRWGYAGFSLPNGPSNSSNLI
jgi:hypothetical protein